MKTFPEACRQIMQPGSLLAAMDGTNSAAEEKREAVNERHRELLKEVWESAEYRSLSSGILYQMAQGTCTPEQAFFSLFGYGMCVGMEMERREDGVVL